MSLTTSPTQVRTTYPTQTFTPFPHLPTELRLKIWSHHLTSTPPQLIPFHLCKSDLDFLRLKRKACHNYPHIFCSRRPVPSILHVNHEARSLGLEKYTLGFDIDRILSMGRAETDVETYTTCSHEVSMGDVGRGVYWDKSKDVVFLDSVGWLEDHKAAYVWGGKTGVRFGKMGRVAMSFETLTSCGIGEYLGWEGVEEILVLGSGEEMEDEGRWWWGSRIVGREGYVRLYLAGRKMVRGDGGQVSVKFQFRNLGELKTFVEAGAAE